MATRRRIGQYEVGEEIGRGGMAVVHVGLDTALRRKVAIKLLHPHLAREAESRRRFQREARAVAQLGHPNIIEIYACSGQEDPEEGGDTAGEESAETYLVTEFVDGPDLRRFVRENPIRLPQIAAMIALPIAGALAHAHARGIIHRDIKPENILIQTGGVLKLTDFGIAHFIDEHMTVTGAILGSPAYMSPEHIEGCALSARSDVFSLGTLLFTLAAGELPFRAETAHALLRQVLDCEIPDPRQSNPLIDDQLLTIIRRAMQRRPEDRFATIAEMERALRRYLEAEGFQEPEAALRLFLDDPGGYQEVVAKSIAARLATQARQTAGRGRVVKALKLYDRLLTLDPADEEALGEVRRLSSRARRRRWVVRAASAGLGVAALAAVAWGGWTLVIAPALAPAPPFVRVAELRAVVAARAASATLEQPAPDAISPAPSPPGPAPMLVLRSEGIRRTAYGLSDMAPRRGRQALAHQLDRRRPPVRPARNITIPTIRRPPIPEPVRVPVVVKAFPPAVRISVDGVERGVGKTGLLLLRPGPHTVVLRHPACPICEETHESFTLDPDNPPNAPLAFRIGYQPATLFVRSGVPGTVSINRRRVGATSRPIVVPMGDRREQTVEVAVQADGLAWRQRVLLTAGGIVRVSADPQPRPAPP